MNKEGIMKFFTFYTDNYNTKKLERSTYSFIDETVDKILALHLMEKAELEAKVYTYEKIIANSNFAPILKESKNKKNQKEKIKSER